jgi:hypothetical protein
MISVPFRFEAKRKTETKKEAKRTEKSGPFVLPRQAKRILVHFASLRSEKPAPPSLGLLVGRIYHRAQLAIE